MDLPRPDADGFTLWQPLEHAITLVTGQAAVALKVSQPSPGGFAVTCPEGAVTLTGVTRTEGVLSARCDGRRLTARFSVGPDRITIAADGGQYVLMRPDPLDASGDGPDGDGLIRSPMPGLVRSVDVRAGDRIDAGATLLVLEAMKIEHTLTAPATGVIAAVNAAEGDQVQDGAVLVEFAEVADD